MVAEFKSKLIFKITNFGFGNMDTLYKEEWSINGGFSKGKRQSVPHFV